MSNLQHIIEALGEASKEHPDWTIGRLMMSAASISRGELRYNPGYATDAEILSGLRALLPDEDEIN